MKRGRYKDLYPQLKTSLEKKNKDHADVANTSISMNQLSHLYQQISKSMTSKIGQLTSTHVSGNLQAYLASSCNTSWIIDSGATDHMSNKFSPVHEVSITNGATVLVSRNGKINFSPQSSTSNVLVVPSFPIKLLSIGKFTNSLNFDVIFSPSSIYLGSKNKDDW